MSTDNTVYKLIIPIEMGSDTVVEELNFHKPNLGELTKVRATDPHTRGLEMLVACTDQSRIVLQKLEYDDVTVLLENFLPDFLGIEVEEG